MDFEIIGEIPNIAVIATGRSIRNLGRLRNHYGGRRWRKLKGLTMKKRGKSEIQFVVCVNNEGYEASLEIGKLYRVVPDPDAAGRGYLSVVDESGEDYAYSADRFFPIEIPQALEKALALAS
jgi:hypothetical protein